MMRAPALDSVMIGCRNLSKTFRRVRVLDGVDLHLTRGERVALIGSNGAGKTTLFRCLLGEYGHDGEVSIAGRDPRRDRTAVLRQVGFVPQLPPPLKMPVGLLIGFAAALCDSDPARIEGIASRLGLDLGAIRDRQFVRLSGGMKQKILIAIALGRDASVLVMDEPAANLDPAARKIFFDLLAERAESTTMLISSHRLDEVATLVNRVVELDRGKVVLDDQIADSIALTARLACRVTVKRAEPALQRALAQWNLQPLADGLSWEGTIHGADRLRFVATLSRYLALIERVSMEEQ
ncbi:MAG: ABC transporter ATP-binding protein [Steroidobacteraceae bacterium]